jgi:hypothetical protein
MIFQSNFQRRSALPALVGLFLAVSSSADAGDIIFRSGIEEGAWIDATGTSFWQCSANCSVQNNQFVEAGAGMTINAAGTWNANLRPLAIRVDASNSPMFQLGVGRLAGGIDFGVCDNYVVNSPCYVDVTSDIQRLNLYISGTIRKIEFYVLQ